MRISVITLATDSSRHLDEAIDSIEHDGPFDLEHIVVHDGDDAFADALKRRYPAIEVVKGARAGATAAAALGVETATGDFILFLHSDDRLCPGALARLAVEAAARPEVRIWTGGMRIFRTLPGAGDVTVRWIVDRDLTRLSLENICDVIPLLTARFCHRSVFAEIGNFDPKFSESSDREFLLRAVIAGVPEASLDIMVSEMRMHEGSRTIHHRRGRVPPYLVEHAAMADMWCVRPDLDRRTRRFLWNWRARETLRLFVHQCRAGQWKLAAAGIWAAERMDPLWIFRIVTVLTIQRRRRGGHDPGA
jgi:glycosyltransferase involved in cell wall biosynthesis